MTPELILALALTAADASQTAYLSRHNGPNCGHMQEDNPVLGHYPSQAKIGAYFAGSAGLLLAGNALLPPQDAKILNYVWIGVEAGAVAHNLSLGVRFSL